MGQFIKINGTIFFSFFFGVIGSANNRKFVMIFFLVWDHSVTVRGTGSVSVVTFWSLNSTYDFSSRINFKKLYNVYKYKNETEKYINASTDTQVNFI